MTMGPLEYMVIEFEGNHFTGEILPELQALRDRGVMRIVDLIFIQKDMDGKLVAQELSDLSEEQAKPFGPIAGDMLRLFSPEDVEEIAGEVPRNSSAAIALIEHTWAVRLKETITRAHGRVLSDGLVPEADVEALSVELAAQEAAAQEAAAQEAAAQQAATQ